jgi:hypothetical protein
MDKRKYLDLIVLLMISVFVVSASAAVYYSMNMQSMVTIGQAAVTFDQGNDWPSGSSLGANDTYVSLSIKAYPNATLTYDEPVNITNNDSVNHTVRLSHFSITPVSGSASVSNFTFINFTLNGDDFDYTTTGDNWNTPSNMGYQTLPNGTSWAVKIETKAAAGATNALTCTIVIAVDVEE